MRRFFTIFFLSISFSAAASSQPYSAIIYDPVAQTEVSGKATSVERPMASLTKLMTAMVALDYDRDLTHRIKGKTREELFQALLVRSNNHVAELFSQNYPGGRKAFLTAMNAKAQSLGMTNTHFDDPSGRIITNKSTAQDVAIMVSAAYSYPAIRRISTSKTMEVEHQVKKSKKKYRTVMSQQPNTNRLILNEFGTAVEVSKTGFTNPAGYCVGVVVRYKEHPYVVVIMGARNPQHRLEIIRNLYWTDIAHLLTT
jgi:D-alanyl-D-alanine endopeptidase (penicillin-binding protein 7)